MASPRALSPTVHAISTSPHARLTLTSPRSSSVSANRPSSPLSPRTDSLRSVADSMDFSSPLPPRPRPMQSQLSQQLNKSQQRGRKVSSNLQLPALPRFHPAKYPSACSSLAGTPRSEQNIPSGPVSPGLQQRVYTEAQRSRYQYQREMLGFVSRGSLNDPASVRLAPLGSPGLPMTPLTLDEPADGYMSITPPDPSQTPTSEATSPADSEAEDRSQSASPEVGAITA